jgi:hypothetical protein
VDPGMLLSFPLGHPDLLHASILYYYRIFMI